MAKVVLRMATSQSPMLNTPADQWGMRPSKIFWQRSFRSCLLAVSAGLLSATLAPTPTSAKEPWETRWEETIAKAKQEGKTVITGRRPEQWGPVMKVFTRKFGVKVEFTVGSSRELADRLLAERRAGRYTTDHVLFGTGTSSRVIIPHKLLIPILPELILPEVTDPSKWYKGRLWWTTADAAKKYYIQFATPAELADMRARYNTKKVSKAEYDSINSAWDFLDPRWKGRIVAFPPTFVRGGTTDFYIHPKIGRKWFVRFYKEMKPTFVQDEKLILDQLAFGAFDIGLFLGRGTDEEADALAKQGAPLGNFKDKVGKWKEGRRLNVGTGGQGFNIMDRAPHPNAARLLVNWWLSKEGQTAYHMHFGSSRVPYPTLREDVTEWGRTNPEQRRRPGEDFVITSELGVDFNAKMQELIELYQAIGAR